MGNNEDMKPSKPEKSSSPGMDQNNMHVYPDWATMQAFYGAQFAVPPYINPAFASPHSHPPYTWAPPQPVMPPYGSPYVPFYSHGGVYSHLASTSLSMEPWAKSSGNTDGAFVKKKSQEFDKPALSIGNGDGNGDSTESETDRRLPDSDETDSFSNGSNGVAQCAYKNGKKRSRPRSTDREDGKLARKKSNMDPYVEVGGDYEKMIKTKENTNIVVELKHMKSSPTNVPLQLARNGVWMQNDRELKRERRKQANRESARRSRLRKQAETEELAVKVEALTAENMTLKSELNKLMESSEQLKLENAALAGKVNDRQPLLGTVNLLARVNSSELTNRRKTVGNIEDGKTKLRQLLDATPRTDAVIAG